MDPAHVAKLVPGWPQPEMDAVNEEQEKMINTFCEKIFSEPLHQAQPWVQQLDETDRKVMGYKYLTARKWNLEEAEKMFRTTVAFKIERQIDYQAYFPPAFAMRGWNYDELNKFFGLPPRKEGELDRIYSQISPYYQGTYHKWDKLNHPILIERTGAINAKRLVERFKSLSLGQESFTPPCVDYHIHLNEVGGRLVRFNDKTLGTSAGRRVLGVFVIFDCHGLGYNHLYKPALELLKANVGVDTAVYPEGLHKLVVVNCPTMIAFAYAIVKLWLDERIQRKIQFVTPDKTPQTLLAMIAAENLPEFLGGKCRCEGGCVHAPTVEQASPLTSYDGSVPEQLDVDAGCVCTREFPLSANDEVAWEFSVAAMNIEFGVFFYPAGAEVPLVIIPMFKTDHGASSYKAAADGKVVLQWSNTYSWLNKKTLTMRVFKT